MRAVRTRAIAGMMMLIFGGVTLNTLALQAPKAKHKSSASLLPIGEGIDGPPDRASGPVLRYNAPTAAINPPLDNMSRVGAPVRQGGLQTDSGHLDPRTRPVLAPSPAMSEGDLVRSVQKELAQRGYEPGVVDGVPGLVTRAAILAYEHDQSLPLTGEPSEALLTRIIMGQGNLAVKQGAAYQVHAVRVTQTVQRALKGLGHYAGATDGLMGPETAAAIRAFEVARGLVPSGRVSGQLVTQLARSAGTQR